MKAEVRIDDLIVVRIMRIIGVGKIASSSKGKDNRDMRGFSKKEQELEK